MNISIEEHFSAYDKVALRVTEDSTSVYKQIADRVTDKQKLKELIKVSKISLDTNLSAIFAELYSENQPQSVREHYKDLNLQGVIDAFVFGFEKECVIYLKQIDKY